jgi:hypothetical protein
MSVQGLVPLNFVKDTRSDVWLRLQHQKTNNRFVKDTRSDVWLRLQHQKTNNRLHYL